MAIQEMTPKLSEGYINLKEKIKELWDTIDAEVPRPDTIFHYTSAEALQNIIDKKVLWASEALCMNDPTEGIFAGRLIAERLRERRTDIPEDLMRLFADERISDVLNNQVFIVSFCSGGDLLNQWRAYGLEGRGYSIGFSSGLLLNGIDNAQLIPVSYSQSQLEELLRRIIDFGVNEITRIKFYKDEFDRYWNFVGNYLLQSVMRFKNPAFQEEREWRLLSFPSAGIKFRIAGGRMVPYFENRFPLDAIRVVRLGPKCSNRDARVVSNYLKSIYGSTMPSVENSVVPMA
ncbi:MAG: DUF2971 domain-containing protein [Bryobacteraceae bacterium]